MPMEGIINASSSRAADGSYEKDMSVEFDTSKHHGSFSHERDSSMNDIAGLMALMQGNMTKDLPGMLALCKERGYDGQQWWWIIILLFLFGGGNLGWGNNRSCATGLLGVENLQMITSTYDRLADLKNAVTLSQADTANRFGQLDSHLCEAIANVINQVRNQGDRSNDQLNDVSRQISSCCCDLKAILSGISCEIRGVGRDVNDARIAIDQRIALSEERIGSKIELGNERLACLIKDHAKDAEIARQNREISQLQSALAQSTMWNKMNKVAARAVEDLEEFSINHYTPTRTVGTTTGA